METKAEIYFWNKLSDYGMLSEDGIIDRNKVDFDLIIEWMESYAKERAVEFHTWYMNTDTFDPKTYFEWYDEFINQK